MADNDIILLKLKIDSLKNMITNIIERENKNRRVIEALEDKYAILEFKSDSVKNRIIDLDISILELLLIIVLIWFSIFSYIIIS